MSHSVKQEESIFHEAVQLTDTTQRQNYLDQACAGNSALRAGVEALLAAHKIATRFFADGGTSLKHTLTDAGVTADAEVKVAVEEKVGARIGRYELLEKIGEGGVGSVYRAEQFEPVRRKVALKVIKLGMDTKNVIARFEAERQALALMDHPNIAHVFDAGATELGRPYFVMELVAGLKVTEYCDQNRLNLRQRLELFVQVCHAIQHAHQKGIIHRDVKPSNILITLQDGVPVPKVIDFGIAKATGEQSAPKTFTVHGHFIGTPAYISPEQAEQSSRDVDTRSDIYSLGVLLYELLTGQTPFDGEKLLQNGLDEMRRTLREEEPRKPSLLLSALTEAELKIAAERRRVDAQKLIVLVCGDLDGIVMKTLEKDRSRRYETANGLASDIQRHLNNEPVLARAPSRWYRLQKLVRRNRGVFAAGGAIAAALIVGLGTATWAFFNERKALRQAEIRGQITQAALAVSRDRPEEADRIIAGIFNPPPSLESALALRALGEWHAVNERWNSATERFTTLLPMDEFASLNVASLDWLQSGVALVESGDQRSYEQFREKAVIRFATATNTVAAERLIKAVLLLPATPAFCELLTPFTETTLPPMPAPISSAAERIVYPNSENFAVVSACSFDGRSVGLSFNQAVAPGSATNRLNYTILGGSVTNVTLAVDQKSVVLELDAALSGEFKVMVNEVLSQAQSLIAPESTVSGTVLNLQCQVMGDAQVASNSVLYRGNVATIVAGGSDVWLAGDHCLYQYLKVTADFDYRLRVQSVRDTDGTGFARAGLMARDSLEDINGHMVMVERNAGTAENGRGTFQVTFRAFAGRPNLTESHDRGLMPLPVAGGTNSWIRLQRIGTTFFCYSSTNETDWVLLHQLDGALDGDRAFTNHVIYLGIATSAHSTLTNTVAVVSDLRLPPPEPVRIVAQSLTNLEWQLGGISSLRVTASGFPVSYQWRKNGVNIRNATNDTHTIANVQPGDAGVYSALVFNDISSLITSDMTVAVKTDTDPPIVNAVASYDGRSVGVTFNKAVDLATATQVANYRITGNNVTNAALMNDTQTVLLYLQSPVAGNFTVMVKGVKDLFRNTTISADTKMSGSVLNLQSTALGDAGLQPLAVSYEGNMVGIQAGGSDISEQGDHFGYQYLLVTNDFDFRLRVRSLRGGGGRFARVGLMARDSLTNISSHQILVAVNAGNTFQAVARTQAGSAKVQSQPPNPLPAAFGSNSWVRLQRSGTAFWTYYSEDGVNWKKLYQFDSIADEDGPFANPIYLGIATSAWSDKQTVDAVVSDLSVTQTMPASMMLSLALLEYRRDNDLKAMDWSRRCIAYPDYQTARIATARVILALCCQRLSLWEEARSELGKARKMIESRFATGLEPGSAVEGFWFDWVYARILLREASGQITDVPKS